MSWFKNVISGAAGVLVVVGLPAVMLFSGGKEALEDNPESVGDVTSTEYHKYNAKQFAEGATFGIYDADKGVTAKGVGDTVYDAGKKTLEFVGGAAQQIFDRASNDLEGVDIPSAVISTDKPSEPDCKDPEVMAFTEECWY